MEEPLHGLPNTWSTPQKQDVGAVLEAFKLGDAREEKAEAYTTTVGSYCEWSRKVNLGPPSPDTKPVPGDEHVLNYYDALQYTLYETGYPETVDRSMRPRKKDYRLVTTIAILSSPVECMAIIGEAFRQCPGAVHLILSPVWLSKQTSEYDSNLLCLYMHKAISFESGGRSYIDVFDPPRRVTYFVNFFTRACTDGQRRDGEPLEVDLDCPMSSSIKLCAIADDKVLTRCFMAEAGVLYPETLAFVYKPRYKYPIPADADITVITLTTKNGVENLMLEEINRFLNHYSDTYSKIVVKPSGPIFHGSFGVSIHDISDAIIIWTSALALLEQLDEGDNILVEIFYAPKVTKDSSDGELSFRLRSTVCRGCSDVPYCTTLVCGVNRADRPINGDNTVPQSLDTTLLQFGLGTERKRLNERVCNDSALVLQKLIEYESKLPLSDKGGLRAQTDLIGIDFVLGEREGSLLPIGIEVNSHDCTINCQLFEFMNPNLKGASTKPLVETMIDRSQRYLVANKNVLVVGSGGFSKRFIWPAAKEYGINVLLVDRSDCDAVAKVNAKEFLVYDYTDHTKDDYHTTRICDLVKEKGWRIDGCCTFWEDNGPLAARLAEAMNLTSQGLQGAVNAKKKSLTQQFLRGRNGDIPHFPRANLYASQSISVRNETEVAAAVQKVGPPCIIKLEYGSSAVGVRLVQDKADAVNTYKMITTQLKCEEDHPGIGLGHGNDMMVMDYINGTEHDIDVIIFKRKLLAAFVSDNGPTRPGTFTETAACMPSCLAEDKVGQLITAAYQCCTEIGLVNGVFNVEMKMTQTGPKLIEINARMAGFYLRDWIKTCYDVDLLLCSFMIFCGIKPVIPHSKPSCQLMGILCVPSVHHKVLTNPRIQAVIGILVKQGLVRYNPIEEEMEVSAEFEEPCCSIAVTAENVEKAKSALLEMCKVLNITTPEYEVADFLRDFTYHMPLPLVVS